MVTLPCPSCRVESLTSDYCDSCGTALRRPATIGPSSPGGTAAPETGAVSGTSPVVAAVTTPSETCAVCGTLGNPDDVYCEGCGINLTTGQVVAASAAGPVSAVRTASGWTAVISADRALFNRNQAGCAQAFTFPEAVAREVSLEGDEIVVGRRHESQGFFPDIDLGGPILDPGVSRRHAVLLRQADGAWAVADNGSTNGTRLNGEAANLEAGALTGLDDGDRIELGLFTVITIRQNREATD